MAQRRNQRGELIVSVAVPIQRSRAILGVLLLSTEGDDIDKIVQAERMAVFRVFGVVSAVMVILSLFLASTIANPLRKLSAAADRVRHGVKNRVEIPDFSERQDEVGHLSTSIRDMTDALYTRIEAIESFAADVSHELKNPSPRFAAQSKPCRSPRPTNHASACSMSSSTTCGGWTALSRIFPTLRASMPSLRANISTAWI